MQMHTTSRLLSPAHCDSAEVAAIKEAARLYGQFLRKGVDCLEAEFLRWKAYWTRHSADRCPKRVLEALSNASILGTFPSISILLRIFATIPVITATGERSFNAVCQILPAVNDAQEQAEWFGTAVHILGLDVEP